MVAAGALVVALEGLVLWMMASGQFADLWLIGAIAATGITTYGTMIGIAVPSVLMEAEVSGGLLRQGTTKINLKRPLHAEYRPVRADLRVRQDTSVVIVSLFCDSVDLLLHELLESDADRPVNSVDRKIALMVAAAGGVGAGLALFALGFLGHGMDLVGIGIPLATALVAGLAAWFRSVRRIGLGQGELVLHRIMGSESREAPLDAAVRFHVRSKGEFWPRVECAFRGAQNQRIPTSGTDLTALATILHSATDSSS